MTVPGAGASDSAGIYTYVRVRELGLAQQRVDQVSVHGMKSDSC